MERTAEPFTVAEFDARKELIYARIQQWVPLKRQRAHRALSGAISGNRKSLWRHRLLTTG